MGPSIYNSSFTGDTVVEPVTEENSSVGDSDFLIISDLNLLFSVVVFEFDSEIVHGVSVIRMVINRFSDLDFRCNSDHGLFYFCLFA